MPWDAVQQHMLERLHASGFDDFDAAHLNVFQYPGPQGARPSELATRLRISKQALNYLLGELERLGYLERRPDPDDLRSKRIALTPRGIAAVDVIREAVGEIETTWAQQLGPERFARSSATSCSSSIARPSRFERSRVAETAARAPEKPSHLAAPLTPFRVREEGASGGSLPPRALPPRRPRPAKGSERRIRVCVFASVLVRGTARR